LNLILGHYNADTRKCKPVNSVICDRNKKKKKGDEVPPRVALFG
jgi:hypothetical protein